jgi:hypothetical protein
MSEGRSMKPIELLKDLRDKECSGALTRSVPSMYFASRCYDAYVSGKVSEDEAVCAYMSAVKDGFLSLQKELLDRFSAAPMPIPIEHNGVMFTFKKKTN